MTSDVTKFFVCTLYCGELDFEHCVQGLHSQQGNYQIEHKIIENLPEHEAHVKLYSMFNDTDGSWHKLKLDADVVLHAHALKYITMNLLRGAQWVDPVVHDYYTDSIIHAGIAAYHANVKLRMPTSTLKCDRNICDVQPVACGVVGKHAHYANEFTGFRYGFHRGLKSQLIVYDQIVKVYAKYHDSVRYAALRGFELAQSDEFADWHLGRVKDHPNEHSYGDKAFLRYFEKYFKQMAEIPPRTWR